MRDFTVPIFYLTGAYTCVAMTQVGTATESGTLTVLGIPPSLIAGPSQVTVKEGSDIAVLCTVYGLPLPKHTWYKVNIIGYFHFDHTDYNYLHYVFFRMWIEFCSTRPVVMR